MRVVAPLIEKNGGIDWAAPELGMVSPIRDQQDCGSCWAFMAVSNIESVYAIKTGVLKEASEQ